MCVGLVGVLVQWGLSFGSFFVAAGLRFIFRVGVGVGVSCALSERSVLGSVVVDGVVWFQVGEGE